MEIRKLKAVCVIGSARSNGSTAYIVDRVIDGMKETGVETKRYALGDLGIGFCCGHKVCYKSGDCIKHDAVHGIVEDMAESDTIVIASPSYWGDVPGQLKTFFDRCTPYSDTNKNRKIILPQGKTGISIAIRAGATDRENLHILESIEHFYGHLGIKPVARLSIRETDSLEDLLKHRQKEINEAYEIGRRIGLEK